MDGGFGRKTKGVLETPPSALSVLLVAPDVEDDEGEGWVGWWFGVAMVGWGGGGGGGGGGFGWGGGGRVGRRRVGGGPGGGGGRGRVEEPVLPLLGAFLDLFLSKEKWVGGWISHCVCRGSLSSLLFSSNQPPTHPPAYLGGLFLLHQSPYDLGTGHFDAVAAGP